MDPNTDDVDEIVEQWRGQRPELELGPMATFGRLGRLMVHATRSIEAVFADHGISLGEFDVLAALRRSGQPYQMKPSELARTLMLSPAGMTSRLDRLEQTGHVDRQPDPSDRRSWIVTLTATGVDVVDRSVADHVANEARMLEPLTSAERRSFDAALRKLLAQFD